MLHLQTIQKRKRKRKEKKRKEDKLIIVEINLEHLKFKLLVPFACLK